MSDCFQPLTAVAEKILIDGWSLPRERAAIGNDRRVSPTDGDLPAWTVSLYGLDDPIPAEPGPEPRRTGERGPRTLEAESPGYVS